MERESECKIQVESRESQDRFILCSRTNVALLLFTLFLLGSAAAVLLSQSDKGPKQQDQHFEELKHSLRQTNVRAAIHLEGKYDEELGTVRWQQDVDQGFGGGLELDQNEIVIPHNGLYFVYSQTSYSVSCSSDPEEDDVVHLSHMVERWTSSIGTVDEPVYHPILHSVRTACERQSEGQERWYSGVYVGAMFDLMKGDRLRTRMKKSTLQYLNEGHGQNFFGVFAL